MSFLNCLSRFPLSTDYESRKPFDPQSCLWTKPTGVITEWAPLEDGRTKIVTKALEKKHEEVVSVIEKKVFSSLNNDSTDSASQNKDFFIALNTALPQEHGKPVTSLINGIYNDIFTREKFVDGQRLPYLAITPTSFTNGDWKYTLFDDASRFLVNYLIWGNSRPCEIDESDIQFLRQLLQKNPRLGLKNKTPKDWKDLTSGNYWLLKLRVQRAKGQILNNDAFNFKKLSVWGFNVVETPADGDLVIYYTDKKIFLVGMYKDHAVLSKWMALPDFIVEHDLFEIPVSYNFKVIFYRLKVSKKRWRQDECDPAEFSPPKRISPPRLEQFSNSPFQKES